MVFGTTPWASQLLVHLSKRNVGEGCPVTPLSVVCPVGSVILGALCSPVGVPCIVCSCRVYFVVRYMYLAEEQFSMCCHDHCGVRHALIGGKGVVTAFIVAFGPCAVSRSNQGKLVNCHVVHVIRLPFDYPSKGGPVAFHEALSRAHA